MMEGARTSETSAHKYFTRHNTPEDSELHTRRRENLKSHNSHDLVTASILKLTTTVFLTNATRVKVCNQTMYKMFHACNSLASIKICFRYKSIAPKLNLLYAILDGVIVSAFATGAKVRGFISWRRKWIFNGDKKSAARLSSERKQSRRPIS
jgi:hypothetical protein